MSTLVEGKRHYMHVISHTHWDREWRYSFQQFRMMLVDMMDHLLDTLRDHPEYKHFHLDAQTIVLDDYFEVKPERRAEVEAVYPRGPHHRRALVCAARSLAGQRRVAGAQPAHRHDGDAGNGRHRPYRIQPVRLRSGVADAADLPRLRHR